MVDHVVLLALRAGVTDSDLAAFGELLASARDRYLPHPAHAPVSAMAQQIAERVLVFDIGS